MSIKINFDTTRNPEVPTLVLAKRNGEKMGALDAYGIVVQGAMTDACEIQFEINKYQSDGKTLTNLWYSVIDFRLIWCKEWDMWFELVVDLDEKTETTKSVSCTQLGQAELSQIMLYDIHINDETDILRDDYEIPTTLFNPEHPEASLLNRILEHAPHYYIRHVDDTIMNIQRTFTFDSESIHSAFKEIAEEIECLFVLPSDSDEDGYINRAIDVYDLDATCNTCGHRGDFTGKCPECGSTDINEGLGEDTTIFITAEELAKEIQFSTDTDAVKNCFKLEGGDDLMTATIRNCNPNGSDRIWYITDQSKADMSDELIQGLADYDELYAYYQDDYVAEIPEDIIEAYNELVTKYREYNEDIEYIPSQITGYSGIMEAYYDTIDFGIYLQSGLMPDASMSDTTAEKEAEKLSYAGNFGDTVAVEDVSVISTASANNAVLAMAKVIVDSRYQVKVNEGDLDSGQRWTGNFKVTNYSDEEDTAISSTITLTLSDDYEQYLRQMIEKELNNEDVNDMSITALFKMDYDEFCEELKKYCLDSLSMFWDAGQACLNILIEQGVADKATWGSDAAGAESNLYELLYLPYYEKQGAIEAEMKLREDEINLILGTYDEEGLVDEYGLQSYIIDERNAIQETLNFENYLGSDLWLEFSAFRREDKYSNSNYISDGLDNAELFARAWEFFEVAQEEIYKSAELQHSISTSLYNLLVIDKFAPLVDYFECGNWLRVQVDDSIYKLRLIEYKIDYDSIEDLSVEFSDVMKTLDGLTDKQDLISKMTSMASSYDAVEHQASQGSKVYGTVDGWSLQGLDVDNVKLVQSATNETQSWDEHGMLFRKYDPITETYNDEQLKIIHSTMVITDDDWETVRTAVGGFYYFDPETGEQKYAYGINGEVLVGQLILGENLGIYNSAGTLRFDENGLSVENSVNKFVVSPDSDTGQLLVLYHGDEQIFYVDDEGLLYAKDANIEGLITTEKDEWKTTMEGGFLRLYYENVYLGSLSGSRISGSSSIRGVALTVEELAQYLAFGHGTTESQGYESYIVDYHLNNGYNPHGFTQKHIFYDSMMINGYAHTTGCFCVDELNYGYVFNGTGSTVWGMWMSQSEQLHINSADSDGTEELYLGANGGGVWYAGKDNIYHMLPIFRMGDCSITPSAANTPTGYVVTFENAFLTVPYCFVSPYSVQPGDVLLGASVANVSRTGMTIYVTKANTETISIDWLAMA